jgi:hypothetical protein
VKGLKMSEHKEVVVEAISELELNEEALKKKKVVKKGK